MSQLDEEKASELIREAHARNKSWGGIGVSPSCKNRCVFCGLTPPLSGTALREMELRVAKNIRDFREQGLTKIEITGCDPIEYEPIIPLIRYLRAVGFEEIQLSTHGRRLSDDKFLKELVSSGLTRIKVPIYGSTAKIHDSITGAPGSFDETISGLRKLSQMDHDLFVQINCSLFQGNKEDLLNQVDLIRELNPTDFYFAISCVSNKDYSYYLPYKDMPPYLSSLLDYCRKKEYPIRFMEMPFCLFGTEDVPTENCSVPPNMGENFQPQMKSEIKDLPSYRLKTKVEMCKRCRCSPKCDGFFVNDINKYGTGNLMPLV